VASKGYITIEVVDEESDGAEVHGGAASEGTKIFKPTKALKFVGF
jgi:hypothetical protein